jgi:hypothetical protein
MFVRNSADLRLKLRFTNHFGGSRSCELRLFRFPINNASPTESTCQKSQLRIPMFTLRIKRLDVKFRLFRMERPKSHVGSGCAKETARTPIFSTRVPRRRFDFGGGTTKCPSPVASTRFCRMRTAATQIVGKGSHAKHLDTADVSRATLQTVDPA